MPDAAGFEEFYQANYGRIVALVAVMLHDRAEAEDVAQEAFARALAHWPRLGGYDLPEAWVRRVAVRIAADSGRRVRRAIRITAKLSAVRPSPSAGPGDALAHTELGSALQRLPQRQREVLILHYLADLSVEQIARDCGLPAGTVKTRLGAARRRLEQELTGRPWVVRDAR